MRTELKTGGKGDLERPDEIRLLRQISDSAEDILFIVDESRTVRVISSASQRHETFLCSGKSFDEFVRSDIYETLKDPIETVLMSGKASSIESALRPDHGVWLHTRLTPISNGSGKITSVLGIVRDISDMKRKEELIASSRKELFQAIDSIPYLLALVDRNHRIKKANKALADHLGMSLPELLGRVCYETFGARSPHSSCPLAHPVGRRPENHLEIRTSFLGRPFLVSLSALFDEAGNVTGCLHMIRNIADPASGRVSREKNAEQLRLLLKDARQVITLQDPKGRYLDIRAIPGNICLPEPVAGKSPSDFYDTETADAICERIRRVIDTGQDLTASVEVKLGDGVWRCIDHISIIRDEAGRISSVMTISERIKSGVEKAAVLSGEKSMAFLGEQQELTRREQSVLQLISAGFTTSQIAEKLFISRKTVETHRARIMQKLDIHKTSSLVRYAVKSGLVQS